MDDETFWRIIEDSMGSGSEAIKAKLCSLSRDDILEFHHTLTRMVAAACTFPLLAANFAIESYVSDEGFREFRAWLVSQGRGKYYSALKDPESIADWLEKDAVDEIDGAAMLLSAEDAYTEKYGDMKVFETAASEPDPDIIQDWPDDKKEYRKRWPKLVDKFWDADRINDMHSD